MASDAYVKQLEAELAALKAQIANQNAPRPTAVARAGYGADLDKLNEGTARTMASLKAAPALRPAPAAYVPTAIDRSDAQYMNALADVRNPMAITLARPTAVGRALSNDPYAAGGVHGYAMATEKGAQDDAKALGDMRAQYAMTLDPGRPVAVAPSLARAMPMPATEAGYAQDSADAEALRQQTLAMYSAPSPLKK